MKENTSTALMIGALIIGLGVGYMIGGASQNGEMQHRMSDSSIANDHAHASMEAMMHDMTASLEGKTGSDFDQEFLTQMIVHHEGAIVMAQMVLEQSRRPELRTLAQDIITAQTNEVAMMRNWQQSWGLEDASVSWIVDDASVGGAVGGSVGGGTAGGASVPPSHGDDHGVACTMDAKVCPDGSAVGRQGPHCEFAKCPGEL